MFRRVGAFAEFAENLQSLIKKELKSPFKIPLPKKIWLWRKGFLSESAILYSFDETSVSDYLSDFSLFFKTPRINGPFCRVLQNKVIFAKMFRRYQSYIPHNYCLIQGGAVVPISDRYTVKSVDDIIDRCLKAGLLVLKPVEGVEGAGVFIMKAVDGKVFINDSRRIPHDAGAFLSGLDDYLVTDYVHQNHYASQIFPDSTNTIRMLTMWDADGQFPFIAIAAHRFGRTSTIPVDNWTRGGLSCLIDMETGTLSKGASYPTDSKVVWHEKHPDTNSQIEGIHIPHWESLKSAILEMAKEIPFVPYVGWDVVITDDGFKVIEGNHNSGLHHLQIHRPLLSIPRVREFYKRMDAI
ncbi:MAG: hypothetical protein O7E52_11660 [Candidatus Poribacteria bacterium]|nr:hypothetical protein [Candidatus Poribacteria bacterium]